MSKKKKRRSKGRSQTYEFSGNYEVITVDGFECVRRSDLERAAWDAALSVGLRDEQAAQVAEMILSEMHDQLARDGLRIYDDKEDKIIEVGPRTDEEGMSQKIKWIEHPRAVKWPTEL